MNYWQVTGSMIMDIIENDVPRSFWDKIAEYLARPPQPVLRFYKEVAWDVDNLSLNFQVRNGLPLPLLYGIYVEADGNTREVTDHIGPFSTDWWSVIFDVEPINVLLKLGLVPLEILLDEMEVTLAQV